MPIYLDRHDESDTSPEEVARLHLKDLELQDRYGVKFLTYWYDSDRRTTFCLVDAPDKETADRVHAEAHGHVANEMISVDLSAVEAFLGRVQDPRSASVAPISETAFRAIMFTDMAGSTEMTARIGDTRSVELLRAHDGIIRRCLRRHHGSEVKHLGDGLMASFFDIPGAVACARSIHAEFAAYNAHCEMPIHVRVGIHAGEPIEEGGDLFGSVVQLAARICAAAEPDTTLVSREIREAFADSAAEFVSRGARLLKGFPDPVELFALTG